MLLLFQEGEVEDGAGVGVTDIIIEKIYQQPVFNWGAAKLSNEGVVRNLHLNRKKAHFT